MRKETFRIIVVTYIALRLFFLIGNILLPENSSSGEGTERAAMSEVDAMQEDIGDVNYMKLSPEFEEETISSNDVVEIEDALLITNPYDTQDFPEDSEVQELDVWSSSSEEQGSVESGDFTEVVNDIQDISIENTQESLQVISNGLEGKEVLMLLSDSLVTNTNGYMVHMDMNDKARAFATDITNFISMDMSVSYNLYSKNIQSCTYATHKLKDFGNTLSFDMCMASGGTREVDVYIYEDASADVPTQEFTMKAEDAPRKVTMDISSSDSIKILVDNRSSYENVMLVYDFNLQ